MLNTLWKYSLERSWRDLSDLHTYASLRPQTFSKHSSNSLLFQNDFFKTIFQKMLPSLSSMLMTSCRNFATIFRKWKTLWRCAESFARVCGCFLKFPKPNKFYIMRYIMLFDLFTISLLNSSWINKGGTNSP